MLYTKTIKKNSNYNRELLNSVYSFSEIIKEKQSNNRGQKSFLNQVHYSMIEKLISIIQAAKTARFY